MPNRNFRPPKKEQEETLTTELINKIEELERNRRVRDIGFFRSLVAAGQSQEAERIFEEHIRDYLAAGDDATDQKLELEFAFAEVQIKLGKIREAEATARNVWEKRTHAHPLSDATKHSHWQLCRILNLQQKYKDAEKMHREVYDREPKDSWALENGDEMCVKLEQQGDFRKAATEQNGVWRSRLTQCGQRDELTIRSGLARIRFLERIVDTADTRSSNDSERELNIHRKKVDELELENMFGEIWKLRIQSEDMTLILDAGHQLGSMLLSRGKLIEAETVFREVWEDRKRTVGRTDIKTLSTGKLFGEALERQGTREKIQQAAIIHRTVWDARRLMGRENEDETTSSGEDIARALLSINKNADAEPVLDWVLKQKEEASGSTRPETVKTRYTLAQATFMQGKKEKYKKAGKLLSRVFDEWKTSPPDQSLLLECGQMLANALAFQGGKAAEAADVIRFVFSRRQASSERSKAYLECGLLYGNLLLELGRHEDAEKVSQSVWEERNYPTNAANPLAFPSNVPVSTEEKKLYLQCGHLYGKSLSKQPGKASEAKVVLDVVVKAQEGVYAADETECIQAAELLENLQTPPPPRPKRVKKRLFWGPCRPRRAARKSI